MKISYLLIFLLPLLCNGLGIDKTITVNTGTQEATTGGDAQATKRSSGSGSLNFLTSIKAGLISGLGRASAGIASSSSSSSSGYKSADVHPNSVEFDPWSLKKSVLNTLFQAVKAITGGVTAIKGQLIKGSGYAISAGGNLLAASGDKVTDLGKNIVNSAQLSPAQPARPAQQHPFLTKFASLSGGSSSLSSQSAQSIDFDTHPSGESLTAYEIPATHANYGPPPKAPTYQATLTKYIPTGTYTTGGGHTSGGGAQFTAAAYEDHHPSSLTFSKYGLPGEAAQTAISEHAHDQQGHHKYHPHNVHNNNENEDSSLEQHEESNDYHLHKHHFDHDDHYHTRFVKENNDVKDHDHQNDQEFSHDHHDHNYIVGYKLSHDVNNADHHSYKSRYLHYPVTSQDHRSHHTNIDVDTYQNATDHDNYQFYYIDSDHDHDTSHKHDSDGDPHQSYNHNHDNDRDPHQLYNHNNDHHQSYNHISDNDRDHSHDSHYQASHAADNEYDHTHELLPHRPFGDWEKYNQNHLHHSEKLTKPASHSDETHDNSTPHLGFSRHGTGSRYRQSTADLLKEIMPYIPKNAKQPNGQKTTIVEQYVIPNDPLPLKTGPIHSISHTQSITTAFGQPISNNNPSSSSSIEIDNAITLPSAQGAEPYDVYHTMNLKYGAKKPSKEIGSTHATYIARPPSPTLDVSLNNDNKYKHSTYITEVVPSIPLKPYHYSNYRPSHLNIGELVAALEARSDTKPKRHTKYPPMKSYRYRRPYQGTFYRRKYY